MKKKSVKQIKKLYIDFINSAPGKVNMGTSDVLFVYLYMFIKGQIAEEELVQMMIHLGVSGLAMSYLIDELEKRKPTLNRYKLPEHYGL